MLKGIDPLISPDLLQVLAAMGHGDEITLVDANFPAASVAQSTAAGQPLRIDCDLIRAMQAVLSLLPLDDFLPDPALTMQVVGDPTAQPPVLVEAEALLAREGAASASLERFAFYERAKESFAVLQTSETRLYGNIILRKGVIAP